MSMITGKDIPALKQSRRFEIKGIVRKQLIFHVGLVLLALLCFIFLSLFAYANDGPAFYLGVISLIVLGVFSYLLRAYYKRLNFFVIDNPNSRAEALACIKNYFHEQKVKLIQLTDDCYYFDSTPPCWKKAKELNYLIFDRGQILMNRLVHHSVFLKSGMRSGHGHFKRMVDEIEERMQARCKASVGSAED